MRLFEFCQLDEYNDESDRAPSKFYVDPTSGLAMNLEHQWTENGSPYLYAVKAPGGKWYGQLHINQKFYNQHIKDLATRWPGAPKSLIQDASKDRIPIKKPFEDPRQAAWFAQRMAWGDSYHSAEDYILDYLDDEYGNNNKSGHIWTSLYDRVPAASDFRGDPLTWHDRGSFHKEKRELEDFKKERREKQKLDQTQRKNEKELGGGFAARMTKEIKKEWNSFYQAHGLAAAKKKFGKNLSTLDQIDSILDKEIEERGFEYFMTGPNSVRVKKPSEVRL